LFALIAFDLFSVNWQNNVAKVSPASYYAPTPIIWFLQEHAGEGKVFNEYQLPLNYGDVFGIHEANGASPLVIQAYKDLLTKLPQQRALALIGVKYMVTWQGGPPGGRALMQQDKTYLHELADPMPAAAVIGRFVVEPDREKALAVLAAPDFEYRERVVVETPLALPEGGARAATIVTHRPQYLDVALPGGPPGLLVLTEAHYPGWRALVDGREAPIVRVNTTFRGVVLPEGARRAELLFEPASVRLGAAVSAAGLLVTLALLAAGLRVSGFRFLVSGRGGRPETKN
jgi:hypothetical protein